MKNKTLIAMLMSGLLASGMCLVSAGAHAQDQADPPYARQLMTDKERTEFHARMFAAKTDAERDQLRREHHAEIKKRAAAKGITVPDEPPMYGRGGMMGAASGAGMGMGPGAGMGPGGRRASDAMGSGPRGRMHNGMWRARRGVVNGDCGGASAPCPGRVAASGASAVEPAKPAKTSEPAVKIRK